MSATSTSSPRTVPLNARLRTPFRAHWPELLTLAGFAALLVWAIPFHEPWADEAQAWQLARSLSFSALFKTYLGYEGSPGLWHGLLWLLSRAGVGYTGLHWICGAIAVAAAAVLLFCSPFPRWLKLPIPFTYFLAFQYALVARNYVLAPLLLFLVATFWKRRPWVVTILLGLLANTSLHLAMISGGLAIVFAVEQLEASRRKGPRELRRLLGCLLLLTAFYACAVWTAKPPHDLAFQTSSGSLPVLMLFRAVALIEPYGLGLLFWIATIFCFAARRALKYLLPVLLCAGFSLVVYSHWWHVGLLFPLLFALQWITWPASLPPVSKREIVGRSALAAIIAIQIAWSAYAFRFDHLRDYSPDRAAAEFLRPYVNHGATIAVTYADAKSTNAFNAVGILPYFDRNIFLNLHHPFWWWSTRDQVEQSLDQALPSHPQVVVVEAVFLHDQVHMPVHGARDASLLAAGYRFTRSFCGTIPEQFGPAFTDCHLIYEYAGAQTQNPLPVPLPPGAGR